MKRIPIPNFAVETVKYRIACNAPQCPYCGKQVFSSSICNPAEICHIQSHKHGGKARPSNLIVGHRKCNRYAGASDLTVDTSNQSYLYLGNLWTDAWKEKIQ